MGCDLGGTGRSGPSRAAAHRRRAAALAAPLHRRLHRPRRPASAVCAVCAERAAVPASEGTGPPARRVHQPAARPVRRHRPCHHLRKRVRFFYENHTEPAGNRNGEPFGRPAFGHAVHRARMGAVERGRTDRAAAAHVRRDHGRLSHHPDDAHRYVPSARIRIRGRRGARTL